MSCAISLISFTMTGVWSIITGLDEKIARNDGRSEVFRSRKTDSMIANTSMIMVLADRNMGSIQFGQIARIIELHIHFFITQLSQELADEEAGIGFRSGQDAQGGSAGADL